MAKQANPSEYNINGGKLWISFIFSVGILSNQILIFVYMIQAPFIWAFAVIFFSPKYSCINLEPNIHRISRTRRNSLGFGHQPLGIIREPVSSFQAFRFQDKIKKKNQYSKVFPTDIGETEYWVSSEFFPRSKPRLFARPA